MRQTNWNNKHSATRLLLLFAVCFSVFIYTAMLLIAEKLGYKFYFSSCFVRFSVFFPLIFWIFCLFAGLVRKFYDILMSLAVYCWDDLFANCSA